MGLSWQQGPLGRNPIGSFLDYAAGTQDLRGAPPPADERGVRRRTIAAAMPRCCSSSPGATRWPTSRSRTSRDGVARGRPTAYDHPGLGATRWFTVRGGTRRPARRPGSTSLRRRRRCSRTQVAFAWRAMDAFYEEDERILGHAADPYHRIDIRSTSRHLTVHHGDGSSPRPTRRWSCTNPASRRAGTCPATPSPRGARAGRAADVLPVQGHRLLLRHRRPPRPPGPTAPRWTSMSRIAGLVSFEPDKVTVTIDGEQLLQAPGQDVVAHGPDRDLSIDARHRVRIGAYRSAWTPIATRWIPSQFGEGVPFSLGVEEELFLVHPSDGQLHNSAERAPRAARRAGSRSGRAELHPSQIELITDVCTERLRGGRSARLPPPGRPRDRHRASSACGTHPTAEEGDSEFTEKGRYQLISELLGDALATPGLRGAHPCRHARRPDRDPRVQRAAASPAPAGGDQRQLAVPAWPRHRSRVGPRDHAARWPRSGAPRAMDDYDGLRRSPAGSPRSPTCPTTRFTGGSCGLIRGSEPWRSGRSILRPRSPHREPRRGRACARPARVGVQADPGPPTEILEEASFRAARAGVAATLPDEEDRLRPVSELLEWTVERAAGRPRARVRGAAR